MKAKIIQIKDKINKINDLELSRHSFNKKARAKSVSKHIALSLYNANPKSENKKAYWNSYYCSETITRKGIKYQTTLCKNRWCITCNNIRTAENIKKYLPTVQKWGDNISFVTLTIPNCYSVDLPQRIRFLNEAIQAIKKRKNLKGFQAIKKIEVTYNEDKKNYHPHLHLLVNGLQNGFELKKAWIEYISKKGIFISSDAQKVKQADLNSLHELFKYFTKIFNTKKDKVTGKKIISFNARAMDTIFTAQRNVKTISTINISGSELDQNIKNHRSDITFNYPFDCKEIKYNWLNIAFNWIGPGAELLSDFIPDKKFINVMNQLHYNCTLLSEQYLEKCNYDTIDKKEKSSPTRQNTNEIFNTGNLFGQRELKTGIKKNKVDKMIKELRLERKKNKYS